MKAVGLSSCRFFCDWHGVFQDFAILQNVLIFFVN